MAVSLLAFSATEIDCIGNPSAADKQTCNRKIIRDNHLYVIKDGKAYSVDGKRVR